MNKGNTYVYFALKGNFDPKVITDKLGIIPTEVWNSEDNKESRPEYSYWQLSTNAGQGYLMVENLVDEVVSKLFDKIETINELKNQYDLHSVLEIVMYVDTNEEESTPAFGHGLKTIEFLYKTQTVTDVDIYRFNSAL